MKRPVLSPSAEVRLSEITDYTVEKWGEEQAAVYLGKLVSCMESLSKKVPVWRSIKDIRIPNVFYVKCEHHVILFKELEGHLAVVSILHENMDMLLRLREDMGL